MSEDGLRLVVEDLGPIGRADVDIRPLTVLIGRNNTGKTYLAQALYAAFRAVDDLQPRLTQSLTTHERTRLEGMLRHKAPNQRDHISLSLGELPLSIQEAVKTWVHRALQDTGLAIEGRLLAYFGEPDLSSISRWDQPGTVRVELQDAASGLCYFGTRSTPAPDLSTISAVETLWPRRMAVAYPKGLGLPDEEIEESITNHEYSTHLLTSVWRRYLEITQLSGSAHYLPAGRSGLLHAWTDVVKLRLQLERERFGLPSMPETSLDGVALDFILSLAEILGRRYPRHRRWPNLRFPLPEFWGEHSKSDVPDSLKLLRELMQGEIQTGSDDDMVPTLNYGQDGHSIAVRRASSMVADLAPLAMWIDRIVRRRDLLIIDEPESHLHPEAIRLVARVLVRLVNEGVTVVCATHSSTLLHELSNCILRDNLSTRRGPVLGRGYTESDILSLEKIAVHRFHRSSTSGPVTVTPVLIEPDWGIPEEEYVKVADEMSDDSARLIDLLR